MTRQAMGLSINGLSTSNVSNQFVRDQLTAQLDSAQTNMYLLEEEISTGHQFQRRARTLAAAAGHEHAEPAGALQPDADQHQHQPDLFEPDRLDPL